MQSHRDVILENQARELLRKARCPELARALKVVWNNRLRTTAGMACYRRKTVFLNPRLVEVAPPREIQRTLRHELAHFVAQERAGRRRIQPHGPEWRAACRLLGIPNESRCHTLPLRPKRMARKYAYQCRQCGTVLARVRPVKRRIACLRCCRKHSNGRYDERFRFVPVAPNERIAA